MSARNTVPLRDGSGQARARARAFSEAREFPRSEPSPALPAGSAAAQRTPWWRHIRLDYRRYRATGDSWGTILVSQGFWASCVYRVSRAAITGARPRFLRRPLRIVATLAQKLMEIVTGICIPPQSEIGEAFYIGHYGSIILPRHGTIGHNCSVAQNVTLGVAGAKENRGAPAVGNRVFIGAHSVVVGKITVGDDAMICAGAVVTRSVPARALVMGNPARVLSYEGSFEHVLYDGMEQDAERLASLERSSRL